MKAVLFDVDFTLIYPGPMFRGEGYRAFCARYGMDVDASKFERAWPARRRCSTARTMSTTRRSSSPTRATSSSRWAGRGPRVDECSREIYDEWAACQHFELYDDVPAVLRAAGGLPAFASA